MSPIQMRAKQICRELGIEEGLRMRVPIIQILTKKEIKEASSPEDRSIKGAKSIPHMLIPVKQWALYRNTAAEELGLN